MLSPPKLVGMFLTQSAHDGDRSQLWLLGESRAGGWPSGFLASFGFALLLRLSRRFELGFGRSLRLRLQFSLGLADALISARRCARQSLTRLPCTEKSA
jgi:hypothetical protein